MTAKNAHNAGHMRLIRALRVSMRSPGTAEGRAMGTAMLTVPPAAHAGGRPGPAGLAFAPVAADIEEADRIFDRTLSAYRSPFGTLIEHLRHYRGKRLRPALLAPDREGLWQDHRRPSHARRGRRDDPHRDARPRRRSRRGRTAPPPSHRERGLGEQGQHPARRHALHPCFPPDEHRGSAAPANIIGEATNRVCAGELRQVIERGNLNLTEADYFAIIEGKTAALTECCGRLGALYAGASDGGRGAAGELRPQPWPRLPDRR